MSGARVYSGLSPLADHAVMATRPPSLLDGELTELDNQLERLGRVSARVDEALRPISLPSPGGSDYVTEASGVAVVDRIRAANARLRALTSDINEALDRLAI